MDMQQTLIFSLQLDILQYNYAIQLLGLENCSRIFNFIKSLKSLNESNSPVDLANNPISRKQLTGFSITVHLTLLLPSYETKLPLFSKSC